MHRFAIAFPQLSVPLRASGLSSESGFVEMDQGLREVEEGLAEVIAEIEGEL